MAQIRAMWLPKVAKAIGWTPDKLRKWAKQHGYPYPYTSEARMLQLLTDSRISYKRYVPTQDAVGVKFVPHQKTEKANAEEVVAPAVETERTGKEKHGKWTDRLLGTRLAKLLPEGPTKKGKARVAYILKKAGIKKIKGLDEAIALEAFTQAGISIDGFEYEKKLGEAGGPLIAAPAATHKALLEQYNEMGERLKKAVLEGAEKDRKILEQYQLLERVRRGLMSYETALLPIALKKFGGLVAPLKYPLDVLDWIRDPDNHH